MNNKSIPALMTIEQTAAKFGLAKNWVRRLVLQDEVFYITAGNKYLINIELFEQFLKGEYKKGCIKNEQK